MDMSESFKEERANEKEYIYFVSDETKQSKSDGNSHVIVRYRCSVLCLGVLCALLLATIIGLCLKTAAETSQIQTKYDNLTIEIEMLQSRYNNLTRERAQLQDRCNAMAAEKDQLLERMDIKQYAVNVTLDPDTAEDNLVLSADGKEVKYVETKQNLPYNPKRFDPVVNILGRQAFSSGRFYYEVQVSGKTAWSLGVARESINRKGAIALRPVNGYWTMWLRDGTYKALAGPAVTLFLKNKPERVGVFVDYGAGLVSFYDADRCSLIYSYRGVSFEEKIYPFFSPNTNNNGNSAPLIITPVFCAN